MGHNPQPTRIATLGLSGGGERKVRRVELLGSDEPLQWKPADGGLIIASPSRWPSEHANAFKVVFAD